MPIFYGERSSTQRKFFPNFAIHGHHPNNLNSWNMNLCTIQ